MYDLFYTNGKTSREVSLGLPKSKKIKANWLSPFVIARRPKKRETVPISFRVDEIDYAILDLFARQCDMGIGSFMNELVRSYVEQNKFQAKGAVFPHAINLSMERLATKLKKMSLEEAIQYIVITIP